MPLRPGDAVEHFVIVSPLGEGGMGQVYVARDTRLQRAVALKIMQPDDEGAGSGSKSGGAARLLREAQSAAALEHPNVVTIFEVGEIAEGEEAGRPFIAMELVKGKTLRAYVGDESVPLKERLRWLVDVARALAAAHKAGLVHRDMKPENVMVREDGVVKVLDFGLAKRAASGTVHTSSSTEAQVLPSLTGKGIAIGTPYYMAPEQMRREVLDGRADQFAWGVVAYELLSGVPAWGRDVEALELVSKLLSDDPRPLGEVRADVPAHVAAAVARAMSKRKGARFDSMEALVAALEDAGGAFAATMPRIAVSEPELPQVPSGPLDTPREKTTAKVVVAPGRPRAVVVSVAAAVIAMSALLVTAVVKREERGGAVGTSASATESAPPRECTKSTECVAKLGGSRPYAIRAGSARRSSRRNCTALFEPGDLTSDGTVWIGAMFPTKGPAAHEYGSMNLAGADFARAEIARATSSLAEGARRRSLALVACDDSADGMRAARHLVDDVGVPAILGFRSGTEAIDIGGKLLVPRGVLVVSTISPNPLITRIPEPTAHARLVWSTTFSFEGVAMAAAHFIHDALEPARHAKTTRIAVVRDDTPSVASFAETLYRNLVFNGKPALDNGHDYQEIAFDAEHTSDEIPRVADRLLEMEPDIIVLKGDGVLTPAVVETVESRWKQSSRPPPIYLLPSDTSGRLSSFVAKSPEHRHRVFAIESLSNSSENARFVIRYNEAHKEKVTRALNPAGSYDAVYLLAYATFALDREAPSGEALSRAFARLMPPGKPIEVGPTAIFDALTTLGGSGSIDLRGAQGAMDFDVATGIAPVDFALLCPDVDRAGVASDDVESGLVYRAAARALEGRVRCP